MDDAIERLNKAIDKFKADEYSTVEFHLTIESIIHSISSSELEEYRTLLLKFESELEYIDYMVDSDQRRQSYLNKLTDLIQILEGL